MARTRWTPLLLLLLLITTSCASADRRLCANSAASYTYYEWKYERECVDEWKAGCQKRYQTLREMKRQVEICNSVQKIGKLPTAQKKELKKIANDVDNASR